MNRLLRFFWGRSETCVIVAGGPGSRAVSRSVPGLWCGESEPVCQTEPAVTRCHAHHFAGTQKEAAESRWVIDLDTKMLLFLV